jgi:hypothetical protein
MSRAILLSMTEADVIAKCRDASVGVSVIERLPAGGVRLVCMSGTGAELIRKKLKSQLMKGEVSRQRHRPNTPLW